MENKEVILAHYLNKSIYPDDTITFNSKGIGIYEGKNNLHQGMYIIYLPSGKYFEFLLGEDQVFSIRTDTSNFVLTAEIEGSDDNRIFFDFQKYMLEKRPDLLSQQQAIKNAANEEEKENDAVSLSLDLGYPDEDDEQTGRCM